LFILIGVFDLWNGLWIILGSAIATYVLTFSIASPMMPWIVFIFVMGIMSVSQLIRQIYRVPDTVIDYTGFVPRAILLLTKHQSTNDFGSKINCFCMECVRWTSKYRGTYTIKQLIDNFRLFNHGKKNEL